MILLFLLGFFGGGRGRGEGEGDILYLASTPGVGERAVQYRTTVHAA